MQPNLAAAPSIMKDTEVNGMWIIPPCLKRSVEVWRVTGESLHEGLERPLHEILRVKPGLYWRPHDTGGTRALECLQGRAANKECK